ncbi:MAG: hypothetical protein IJG18_06420 [Kiritimatiellae bacterium]|nr:hypothetical protein [Kiritimatiellia bacterium]
MRRKTAILLAAAASCLCFDAVAERQPIDRYQSIIDRQMFGQPPPNFDPTKPPSQVQKGSGDEKELTREQEAIKSAIHFSAINVTPAGDVAVGFTDNSDSKMPVHYYLKVGEERNGWKVLEADPVKATMKVAKDDIEVALDLGANSAKGGGSTARAGVNAAPAFATANRRTGFLGGGRRSSMDGEQPRPGMMGASLRERRAARELARQEAAAKEKELEAKRQAEAAEKEKEREAQRQAEKEEQRRELQLLKDELRAQREAVERARAEREAARSNENAEDEN